MKSCESAPSTSHTHLTASRCLPRTKFKVLRWLFVSVFRPFFRTRLRWGAIAPQGHWTGWMAGLPPQLTVYGPPFSIATPKLPANSVQKNIESSPTCFSHTTKPTMTRCTTYSTDIHLIYAIFRELHGIQRRLSLSSPKSQPAFGPFKWITRRRTNSTANSNRPRNYCFTHTGTGERGTCL